MSRLIDGFNVQSSAFRVTGFKVLGSAFRVMGSKFGVNVHRLGSFTFADADSEIEDRTDKRNQRYDPPHRLFFDTAEIFPCNIDKGPAGGQKEDNAGADNHPCFSAQADSFNSFEILRMVFT